MKVGVALIAALVALGLAAWPPEYQPEEGLTKEIPPQFRRMVVDHRTVEPSGTIIIDTLSRYLSLTLGNGKAIRYGVGVGREGFYLVGHRAHQPHERMAGLGPAKGDDRAPALPAAVHGWGRDESAWRAGDVSGQY